MNLLDIPILSTAVAIVISWAIYALFCSYILEAWVQIKAERGRFMKEYLQQQLKDDVNGINWADLIYSNGAIDLLSRDPKKPSNEISPRLFAETLITVVGSAQLVQSQVAAFAKNGNSVDYKAEVLRDFKYGTLLLNSSDVVSLFRQAMNYAELKALKNPDGTPNETELHNQLLGYLEKWFSEFTERLTLWYKKKTRERLFYLGAFIAIIINVDSFQLFTFFENNPKASAEVIRFYKNHPDLEKDTIKNRQLKAASQTIAAGKPERKSIDSLIRLSDFSCEEKISLSSALRQELKVPDKKYLDSLYNLIGRSKLLCEKISDIRKILADTNETPDTTTIAIVDSIIDRSSDIDLRRFMKRAFNDLVYSNDKESMIKSIDSLVQKSQIGKQRKDYLHGLLKFTSDPALNQLTNSLDSLIRQTKLPIGIQYNAFKDEAFLPKAKADWTLFALKFLGFLISGFAASFGAPFWFDLLKKATSKS